MKHGKKNMIQVHSGVVEEVYGNRGSLSMEEIRGSRGKHCWQRVSALLEEFQRTIDVYDKFSRERSQTHKE